MSQHPIVDRPVQELLEEGKKPRFGSAPRKGPATLFSEIAGRLHHLSEADDTKNTRAEVLAVWNCPWWGLRVNALNTLAAWGGAKNKAWLIERVSQPEPIPSMDSKEYKWWLVETRAAMRAVRSTLDDTDAGWVLTMAHQDVRAQFEFWRYVKDVPDHLFLAWLPKPLLESRGVLRNRLLHMLAWRTSLPNYMLLMQTFADDSSEAIAVNAMKFIVRYQNLRKP